MKTTVYNVPYVLLYEFSEESVTDLTGGCVGRWVESSTIVKQMKIKRALEKSVQPDRIETDEALDSIKR